jgi:hypothetical protein
MQLKGLELKGNFALSGRLPPSLGQLARLERLSIAGTDLEGGIPSELAQLTKLQVSLQPAGVSLHLVSLTNLQVSLQPWPRGTSFS